MTHTNSTDIKLASQIASRFFRRPVDEITPVVGRGSVNKIFIARAEDSQVVVRMRDGERVLAEYEKEAWCIARASEKGIGGPSMLSIGVLGATSYMIQTLLRGANGDECGADSRRVWRELGRYAKLIHSVDVAGYGGELTDPVHGRFEDPPHEGSDGSWPSYIRYNIESLSETDELLKLRVLTARESEKIKQLFEGLRGRRFDFGLTHRDLALRNTIVDDGGRVGLFDWGSARVDVVPHADLNQMLSCQWESGDPNDEELRAFLDGYGLSPKEFELMRPELETLLLLRALDVLRWAIDRQPDAIHTYAASARRAVQKSTALGLHQP